MSNDKNHSSEKQQPDIEKAETDLLKASLSRSYKERFLMPTRLYKIQLTMKKAVIAYQPYISKHFFMDIFLRRNIEVLGSLAK